MGAPTDPLHWLVRRDPAYEICRVPDATALCHDGRLVATAMYSTAGRCWNVTDERTVTHLSRHADRASAESHLGLVGSWEWL